MNPNDTSPDLVAQHLGDHPSKPAPPEHLQPAAEGQAFAVPEGMGPKRPVAGKWQRLPPPGGAPPHTDFWQHQGNGFGVVSTFGQKNGQLVYLLSIGRRGSRRCTTSDAQMVLLQFGLAAAEEVEMDGQGFTRNYIAAIPAA